MMPDDKSKRGQDRSRERGRLPGRVAGRARLQPTPPSMTSASKLSAVDKAALLLTSLALAGVLLETAAFWRRIGRARRFAAAGRRFERRLSAQRATVLILGDSTGVGVGATRPEESIAGLLAADYPEAHIVNVAVSGTSVAGAIAQVRTCLESGLHFDLALLHVGGNDVVVDTPLHQLTDDCDTLLRELGRLSDRTVWLGPPDLGLAPLFPRPYAWVDGVALPRRVAGVLGCSRSSQRRLRRLFRTSARGVFQEATSQALRDRRLPSEQRQLQVRLYHCAEDARAPIAARLNQHHASPQRFNVKLEFTIGEVLSGASSEERDRETCLREPLNFRPCERWRPQLSPAWEMRR